MVERGRSTAHWSEVARRAEALGYDTLLMPDHITDQLAPMLALTAAAEATKTLRVGSFGFANDYRNPVLLSREAATLDLLSGGRLEVGIGAGWKTSDYEQLGIPYDTPKTRVDRMEEAVGLIKRLWTEEHVTHQGAHYRIRDATALPRPVQRPPPPVMIGGGRTRILAIAARETQHDSPLPPVGGRGQHAIRAIIVGSVTARGARLRRAKRFAE